MPLVSVVMPVRNAERHLAEAVDSILGQTVTDLELVVVDDGSSDATSALLAGYAARDPRVRVLTQAPSGIVPALQAGLHAATADLAARMDADDIARPERLERQVEVFRRNPAVALVGTACALIDGNGASLGFARYPTGADEVRAALRKGNCIAHPTVMMRREAVIALGGYRAPFALGEDFDLWLRLSEKGELVNLDEPLLRYRMHAGQSSWRDHEQRITTELAATACAALRRAGRPEPALPAGAVDRPFLRACGLSEAAIARETTVRAVGAAEEALRRGLWRSAAGAARVALRQRGLGVRWSVAAASRLAAAAISPAPPKA